MFVISVDVLFGLSVPESDCLVISSRHYQSTIRGETGTPYPVTVTTETELELLTIDSPHLKKSKRGREGEWLERGVEGKGREKQGQSFPSLPPSLSLQTLTVLSSEAVRREWPSLAKLTHLMVAVCARRTVDSPFLQRNDRTHTTGYNSGRTPPIITQMANQCQY